MENELAHDIMDEKRFVSYKQIAWHTLGTVIEERVTATEALEIAGLDFPIDLVPVSIESAWGAVETNAAAIVRGPTDEDPNPAFFGMATDKYEIISNRQLAAMLDPLTEVYPVETAGALGKGETIFFCLDAGAFEIRGGEQMHAFFCLRDVRTGNHGLDMVYTPVRWVCRNTMQLGMQEALVHAKLSHTSNLRDDLDLRLQVMAAMQTTQDRVAAMMGEMTMARLVNEQIKTILDHTYPDPPKPQKLRFLEAVANEDEERMRALTMASQTSGRFANAQERWAWQKERLATFRLEAVLRYQQFNDETPAVAGTAWALYQSVLENEQYRVGSTSPKAQPAAYGLLFGDRGKTVARAWEACLLATHDNLVMASN